MKISEKISVFKILCFVDDLDMSSRAFFLLLLAMIVITPDAYAEYICRAELHYKWKPFNTDGREVDNKVNKKTENSDNKDGGDTPKDDAVSDGSEDVFWEVVEAKGATQDDAKQKLQGIITKEYPQVQSECRNIHENQTKCLSSKYAQNVSSMSIMSFRQRKEFEKRITEDCDYESGRCLGSSASEPVCVEIKAQEGAQGTPEAAKGKEAKKK